MAMVLCRRARARSAFLTNLRSTDAGTRIPCGLPRVRTHMHRALWIWPAIILGVRRGTPGMGRSHIAEGKVARNRRVTRALVSQAGRTISSRRGGWGIGTASVRTGLTPNARASAAGG